MNEILKRGIEDLLRKRKEKFKNENSDTVTFIRVLYIMDSIEDFIDVGIDNFNKVGTILGINCFEENVYRSFCRSADIKNIPLSNFDCIIYYTFGNGVDIRLLDYLVSSGVREIRIDVKKIHLYKFKCVNDKKEGYYRGHTYRVMAT